MKKIESVRIELPQFTKHKITDFIGKVIIGKKPFIPHIEFQTYNYGKSASEKNSFDL